MAHAPVVHRLIAFTLTVCSAVAAGVAGAQPALVSGKPIPVGTIDRLGPLSGGVSVDVVGYASMRGGAEPDLFVGVGGHTNDPGLFLYRFVRRTERGEPVFADPVRVAHLGENGAPPEGAIFQTPDGKVYGFWIVGKQQVMRSVLDTTKREFVQSPGGALKIEGLPYSPRWVAVTVNDDGSATLFVGVKDNVSQRPEDPGVKNWRDPAYRPFDGAGVYRGGWPMTQLFAAKLDALDAGSSVTVTRMSATESEALLSYGNFASVDLGPAREHDLITGSHFGNFLYYHNTSSENVEPVKQKLAADHNGLAIRHLVIAPKPVAYPNPDTGRASDLLVSGESSIYLYRFSGQFTGAGAPIYDEPVSVLTENADLYAGSLPVINIVDWNGDGTLDIVAGNSTGHVRFFRNIGSNEKPAFENGVFVEADGEPIHIQPGYSDVQGPQEARWGYSCPTVADWNEDGLPDLLMGSPLPEHLLYLNIGTRTEPKLAAAKRLYCRGLELHGTWRVKPGVAKLGDRMAYVALDDNDQFHLYYRIDDQNLEDGGKLKLDDGKPIGANFIFAGGTGRSKIVLADWDLDGVTDLLVATPRHGSIPNPEHGLPQSLGLKGAAVVYLRNVGTDEQPVFAYPTLMQFRGEPIYLGQHSASVAVANFGDPDGPNLVVSNEQGRFFYYARRDLSWGPIQTQESP